MNDFFFIIFAFIITALINNSDEIHIQNICEDEQRK